MSGQITLKIQLQSDELAQLQELVANYEKRLQDIDAVIISFQQIQDGSIFDNTEEQFSDLPESPSNFALKDKLDEQARLLRESTHRQTLEEFKVQQKQHEYSDGKLHMKSID